MAQYRADLQEASLYFKGNDALFTTTKYWGYSGKHVRIQYETS